MYFDLPSTFTDILSFDANSCKKADATLVIQFYPIFDPRFKQLSDLGLFLLLQQLCGNPFLIMWLRRLYCNDILASLTNPHFLFILRSPTVEWILLVDLILSSPIILMLNEAQVSGNCAVFLWMLEKWHPFMRTTLRSFFSANFQSIFIPDVYIELSS